MKKSDSSALSLIKIYNNILVCSFQRHLLYLRTDRARAESELLTCLMASDVVLKNIDRYGWH